jgi:hypothetical protein|tara:strand:- start:2351 stop:2869 length:519 start_codon:yes stop_codon:yes gene_type:complete
MSFLVYLTIVSICVAICLLRSNLGQVMKVLLVIILLHGYLTSFSTFRDISGYPTASDLPEEFEVVWGRAVEMPQDKVKFIELWVTYDFSFTEIWVSRFSLAHRKDSLSRVYRLPYSQENHEFVLEMQQAIKLGKRMKLSFQDISMDEKIDLREAAQNYAINHEEWVISKQSE